jgi:hypothetical protein
VRSAEFQTKLDLSLVLDNGFVGIGIKLIEQYSVATQIYNEEERIDR